MDLLHALYNRENGLYHILLELLGLCVHRRPKLFNEGINFFLVIVIIVLAATGMESAYIA